VDRVLETLGLVSIADRPAQGFSEGERVKVALGCAIVHDPSHVVLDEPTSGLDVRTVRALRGWLRDLRDRGACIVFSSHVLGDVEQLCDRVVVMARGAVVAEGALADVRNGSAPGSLEDAFVALTEPQAALSC
jgi:sodium transport system ATP-binding protein